MIPFNGPVVETIHIIDFKQLRWLPVGIAMYQMTGKTMIVVWEVVKRDSHEIVGVKIYDRRLHPVVVGDYLKCVEHRRIHNIALSIQTDAQDNTYDKTDVSFTISYFHV